MPISFKCLCFLSSVVWFIIVEPREDFAEGNKCLKLTASKNNSNHKDDLHEDYKRFIILKNGPKPLNFGQGNFLMKPGARIYFSTKKRG